jgi:hypothetical protein
MTFSKFSTKRFVKGFFLLSSNAEATRPVNPLSSVGRSTVSLRDLSTGSAGVARHVGRFGLSGIFAVRLFSLKAAV